MARVSGRRALSGYGAFRALRNWTVAFSFTFAFTFPLAAWSEPLTLVAFGDSLTQGYGLPPDQGLVPQLQAWLSAQGAEVTVVNAGVSGDTTAGGAARIDWTLTPDVDAMILTLGGNDLLRGIDPAVSRANLDAILTATSARGIEVLLMAMQAPGNYGPDYKRDFDAIYPDLAQAHGALAGGHFFAPLTEGGADAAAAAKYMQPDGIHPSAEGVARIVQAMGPQVLALLDRAAAR